MFGATAKRHHAAATGDAKTLFNVTCHFSNATTKYERDVDGNPVSNPEDIVPKVDISFDEYSEPATDAHLIGFTDASETDPFTAAIKTPPPYLSNRQSVDVGNFTGGPVVNSANDAVPNIQQRRHNKRITYWTWHRNWDSSWEQFLDKVNLYQLTISQFDQEGIRLQYSFAPLTVVVNDLIKEDHWRNGRLYFRRGIAMMHNPRGWLTKINDEGYNEALFNGQYKGGGATTYTTSDLTTNDPMSRTLTNVQGSGRRRIDTAKRRRHRRYLCCPGVDDSAEWIRATAWLQHAKSGRRRNAQGRLVFELQAG
jgi:hypothetical protein